MISTDNTCCFACTFCLPTHTKVNIPAGSFFYTLRPKFCLLVSFELFMMHIHRGKAFINVHSGLLTNEIMHFISRKFLSYHLAALMILTNIARNNCLSFTLTNLTKKEAWWWWWGGNDNDMLYALYFDTEKM